MRRRSASEPGRRLRALADRIDPAGAAKLTCWSFTFERGKGLVFRQDGRGCPLAYLGDADYQRAHDEAIGVTGPVPAYMVQLPGYGVTMAEAARNWEENLPHLREALGGNGVGGKDPQ